MAVQRKEVAGTERVPPDAPSAGPVDPNQTATISLYVKPRAAPPEPGAAPVIGRAAMKAERETAMAGAFARITAFAAGHNLTVVESDAARRLVKVSGKLSDLSAAFGADLTLYRHTSGTFRGRTGVLTAPSDIADDLEAVLGLDQRPIATPKLVRVAAAAANTSYPPNAVAALYGFPKTSGQGAGECIAIIELGGGVSDSDTQAAFQAMGLPAPTVAVVGVDGAASTPGTDTNADGEVALDVQVAGGAAPGARLAVYFAPNTDQGFVDAITQAVHDTANKPSVMSISWGGPESTWTQQAVAAMTSAFQDAATAGVSVFAASGDGLATDGVKDGKAHVDFPSSSPWVVGCGGTAVNASGGVLGGETVWNSNGGGTGGGVSDLFPVPAYQSGVKIPAEAHASHKKHPAASGGRGVPDVASDADPSTGYRVVVDGKAEAIGGTSAAAPLWAGLFALVNEAAGKPAGQPHATLYANPAAFNDVTHGNNKSGSIGYSAAKGWDACTGLGTPKGAAVAKAFG